MECVMGYSWSFYKNLEESLDPGKNANSIFQAIIPRESKFSISSYTNGAN